MVPYTVGPDLDIFAAGYGVERSHGETDERFRRRVKLAPEAFAAAGSVGGYIYHALTAAPSLLDVSVQVDIPGHVVVTCMDYSESKIPDPDLLVAIHDRLTEDDVQAATDVVTVRAPTVVPVPIAATLFMQEGVGQAEVLAEARAALDAYITETSRLGGGLYRTGMVGALQRPGVIYVTIESPAGNVVLDRGSCFRVSSIAVSASAVPS